jgi:hypothetical protein
MSDYVTVNRANWDERAAAHAASRDYAVDGGTADPQFLGGLARFDRPRLADLAGLRGVHRQWTRDAPGASSVGTTVPPWDAFAGQMAVDSAGDWRLADQPERLAASYRLQAVKQ